MPKWFEIVTVHCSNSCNTTSQPCWRSRGKGFKMWDQQHIVIISIKKKKKKKLLIHFQCQSMKAPCAPNTHFCHLSLTRAHIFLAPIGIVIPFMDAGNTYILDSCCFFFFLAQVNKGVGRIFDRDLLNFALLGEHLETKAFPNFL